MFSSIFWVKSKSLPNLSLCIPQWPTWYSWEGHKLDQLTKAIVLSFVPKIWYSEVCCLWTWIFHFQLLWLIGGTNRPPSPEMYPIVFQFSYDTSQPMAVSSTGMCYLNKCIYFWPWTYYHLVSLYITLKCFKSERRNSCLLFPMFTFCKLLLWHPFGTSFF